MNGDLTYFKKNAVNYYGVFCKGFDTSNPYDDILTEVRKNYYESGLKTQKNKFILKNDGVIYRYNYVLNEDTVLKWKVFNESHIVERVIVSKEDNYRVEVRDSFGKTLKKCIYFGTYHNWVKTKYFTDDIDNPAVELAYWDKKGVAVILKYTADGDDRYPQVLYPCTAVQDKVLLQKIIDKLGVPEVSTLCSNGLVYFAEHSISKQWSRYAANPKLLEETSEQPRHSNVDDKTAVFEPVKDKPKADDKKTEQKRMLDLTQTYDVIIPNAVQADSVVINKSVDEQSAVDSDVQSSVPSRLSGTKSSGLSLDLGSDYNNNLGEAIKPRLHSDALLNDDEQPAYSPKPMQAKKVDVFDYLSDDDTDDELEQGEKEREKITLNIGLDEEEDDEDSRILDRSNAVGNEPPKIFNDTPRAYSYKKVRTASQTITTNPFAEYSDSTGDSIEDIAELAKRKTIEDVKQAYEISRMDAAPNTDGAGETTENKISVQKKTLTKDRNSSDSISQSSTYRSMGVRPNKVIRVSDDEFYCYYGGLNEQGKRDGQGRTAMKNGMTAYDGGYSNDLRNGFGVYYYRNGKICYVGDWKNNRRNGVGISFNHKDRSMYVGGWEDDCPVGMGAKFDENGDLTFAGRYENGTREGIGMMYNPKDGSVFVSRWDNDKLSDRGTVFDAMGNLVYNGSWKKGTRNGEGTQYDKQGLVVYSGEWKNGKYDGEGTLNLSNGYKIVGEFHSGKIEGYAVVTTKKGRKLYEGRWRNNRYNGEGKLYNTKNGSWCQGIFENGTPVGVLLGYSNNGELLYEGEWQNGKYHGSGICYEHGEKVYEGQWENGIRSGSGKEFKNGELIYDGSFANNKRNGLGVSYNVNGGMEYSGLWRENAYDGIGVFYDFGKPRLVGCFSGGKPHGRINEVLGGVVVKECIYANGECVYMREYTDDGLTLKYEGRVRDGSYDGMGCLFSAYGEKSFEGIFKKNEPFKSMKVRLKKLERLTGSEILSNTDYERFSVGSDYAIEQDYNGGAYSGLLLNGKPSGKGTIIYTDHGYTGSFVDGLACGLGVIYEWDGSEIKGTFDRFPSEMTTEVKFANGVSYYLKNS